MNQQEVVERLPLELEYVSELPGALLLELLDMETLRKGTEYFIDGRIRSLEFKRSHRVFMEAKVKGRHSYTVRIALDDEEMMHQCNCPAHPKYGQCKHVAAVFLAMYYLVTDELFEWESIPRKVHKTILESLMDSIRRDALADTAHEDRELKVFLNEYDQFAVEAEGHMPDELLTSFRFHSYSPYSSAKKFSSILWGDDSEKEFLRLVRMAWRHDIPIKFSESDNVEWKIQSEVTDMKAETVLDFQVNAGRVVSRTAYPGIDGNQKFLEITRNVQLLDDGRLIHFPGGKDNPVVDIADPDAHFFEEGRRLIWGTGRNVSQGVKVSRFNEISLAIAQSPKKKGLPPVRLQLDGEPVCKMGSLRPVPIQWKIHLDENSDQKTPSCGWLSMTLAGCPFPHGEELLGCLKSDLLGNSIDHRLMSAKGRVRVLSQAARRLLFTDDKSERKAIIEETADDRVFVQLRLKNKAIRWMRRFEKNWISPKKSAHLVALHTESPRWCLVSSPAREFATLLLAMNPTEEANDLFHLSNRFRIAPGNRGIPMATILTVAQVVEAELEFKGKPLECVSATVSVEAEGNRNLDWFELRSELRCGELTIPQEEWEKLVQGDLILKDSNRWVIPKLDNREALERLCQLVGANKRAKTNSRRRDSPRVSRLEIFDWLALRRLGAEVILKGEAKKVFDSLYTFSGIPTRTLPRGIKASLRPYQREGFDWLLFLYRHRFGACLADDMGLGKTLQAITFLLQLKKEIRRKEIPFPHLIVVPPTLIFNWQHEIERFAPALQVSEYHGKDRNLDQSMKADLVLTTYGMVQRDIERFKKLPFNVLIIDEAQFLKNLSAVRTRAMQQIQRRFTLCLTGTPLENHIGEYYSIMQLAVPGLFGKYRDFMEAYRENPGHVLARSRPFVLRRTKQKIIKELPPKIESDVYLEMTEEQKEIYTRTVGEVRAEVLEAYKLKTRAQAGIAALAAILRLRQVCISPELLGKAVKEDSPKVSYLLAKMEELIEENQSALVFSQFTRTLDLLQDKAKAANIPILRLDGSVPAARRKKLVETFQLSKDSMIFLISLRAGGVGLNLTRAQTVFHADPWWNPAVENQASDRAHRIGQKNTVFIHRVLMRHSIEEKIMILKERKQKLFDLVLRDAKAAKSGGSLITREDFDFLLEAD